MITITNYRWNDWSALTTLLQFFFSGHPIDKTKKKNKKNGINLNNWLVHSDLLCDDNHRFESWEIDSFRRYFRAFPCSGSFWLDSVTITWREANDMQKSISEWRINNTDDNNNKEMEMSRCFDSVHDAGESPSVDYLCGFHRDRVHH